MFERGIKHFKTWSYSFIVRAIVLALFGIAGLSGVGFIVAGSYLSLSEILVPWAAGLIVGCGLLVISLMGAWITIVSWQKTTQEQTPDKPDRSYSATQNTVETAEQIGEIVGARFSKSGIRTIDVMIAALVAGTILGAGPSVRKRLSHRKRHGHPARTPKQKESNE